MNSQRYKTLAEQVAHDIKLRVRKGQWTEQMPGRQKLATELGVNHKTCGEALKLLEAEGLLKPQGKGLGRTIVKSHDLASSKATLRVRILLYENSDLRSHFLVELLHRLREMGHDASYSGKTMRTMGMSMQRITNHVRKTEADAWIVIAGPQNVLEWFAEQPFPSFALFGRMGSINIASIIPNKLPAIDELIARLVEMNHQRIVLITREDRRKPVPGASEKKFIECLAEQGLTTSSYNLPDWGDSPAEMVELLESLFRYTPPTAIILSEATLFISAMQWLSRKGISAPETISLACMDPSHSFEWCLPEVTHISWKTEPLVNRMVNWVNNIKHGKKDLKKVKINAKLFHGGTIGPANQQG